jgi:hypothetical protein
MFLFGLQSYENSTSKGRSQNPAARKPGLFCLPRIHEYRIILLCIRACVFCYYEEMKMLFHSCIRGCFFQCCNIFCNFIYGKRLFIIGINHSLITTTETFIYLYYLKENYYDSRRICKKG